MEEKPETPTTAGFAVVVPDAPELPLLHVNALNIRIGVDEFFLTLGMVLPPDFASPEEMRKQLGKGGMTLTAEPVFRFAVSRQTMAAFLELLQKQYRLQTVAIETQTHIQEATHTERDQ